MRRITAAHTMTESELTKRIEMAALDGWVRYGLGFLIVVDPPTHGDPLEFQYMTRAALDDPEIPFDPTDLRRILKTYNPETHYVMFLVEPDLEPAADGLHGADMEPILFPYRHVKVVARSV